MSRGWAKASACRLQMTLSCAVLCHVVSLQYLSRSSLHRLAGLPHRLFLSPLHTELAPDTEPPVSHYRTCPYTRAGWLPPGKYCTAQVLNLTQHIEDGFETGKIIGIVLLVLSAAYDTVNHRRLLEKVYNMTRDNHLMCMIRTLLKNRRFFVELGGKISRWRSQRNGLPQGSVLAPLLFNVYTNTTSLFTRAHVALCMLTTLLSLHRARTLNRSRKH